MMTGAMPPSAPPLQDDSLSTLEYERLERPSCFKRIRKLLTSILLLVLAAVWPLSRIGSLRFAFEVGWLWNRTAIDYATLAGFGRYGIIAGSEGEMETYTSAEELRKEIPQETSPV